MKINNILIKIIMVAIIIAFAFANVNENISTMAMGIIFVCFGVATRTNMFVPAYRRNTGSNRFLTTLALMAIGLFVTALGFLRLINADVAPDKEMPLWMMRLIFMGLGTYMLYSSIADNVFPKLFKYPKVTATCVSKRMCRVHKHTRECPELYYNYEGIEYLDVSTHNIHRHLNIGDTVEIYLKPNRPQKFYSECEVWDIIFSVVFFVCFFGVGCIMFKI